MTFRAIAIDPSIAPVILKELDLVIMDYENFNHDYIVAGFGGEIDYLFYTSADFHKEWRFIFGQDPQGRFGLITAR